MLTKVTYSMIEGMVYNAMDYGAVANGTADNTLSIQAAIAAISAAGGGTLYFPPGVYGITDRVHLASNVNLKGDGKTSVIKVIAASGFNMLNGTWANVENVVIDGLAFDGSMNYPANSQTYKQTYPLGNRAINIGGVTARNITIKNCYFNQLAGCSINIQSDACSNINISNNEFYKGSYVSQVINIRAASGSPIADGNRPTQILVDGNIIDTCGPQYHYNPAYEDWVASTDAIIIDKSKNAIVSNNIIKNTGGGGIRIEESLFCSVIGNSLSDIGGSGISCYKWSYYVTITGNTIKGWGKIPPAYAIRNYSGTYVYAKEFPNATYAPLPANPTASSWFATWPYDTTNVDMSQVIAYSDTDYYVAQNQGILPYRGSAAISVVFESWSCTVTGNNCVGNTTQNGSGKYYYSSDFGYTNVHPSNNSNIVDSGNRTYVVGNNFHDVRVYGVYAPAFQDPINGNGAMGTGCYIGNYESSVSVALRTGAARLAQVQFPVTAITTADPNTLDDYEEGTFMPTLQIASATTGITYTTRTGTYVKIGAFVHGTIHITLSSKGALTGPLKITGLPFLSTTDFVSSGSEGYVSNVSGWNVPKGYFIEQASGSFILDYMGTGGNSHLTDANLTNTSEMYLSFSYRMDS